MPSYFSDPGIRYDIPKPQQQLQQVMPRLAQRQVGYHFPSPYDHLQDCLQVQGRGELGEALMMIEVKGEGQASSATRDFAPACKSPWHCFQCSQPGAAGTLVRSMWW